jgi:hypothetical protein
MGALFAPADLAAYSVLSAKQGSSGAIEAIIDVLVDGQGIAFAGS